ncbi:EamA family transporter [Gordonia sp. LSe1-13]|uniref:EamA family transporter n=1 Tax=Gordonia sesuvii TaxID=3116777 RepID=A0ABU7MG40_9ACTN|nr:EamA family transporter [Gordonia sp. LSe1-13]
MRATATTRRSGFGGVDQTGPAVLMILGSCISLQFGAALAVHLFPHVGALGATALRLAIAALILLVVIRPDIRRWTRTEWKAVLAFGIAIGAMNAAFYSAIDRIPLGVAVSIEFAGPLILAAALSRSRADLAWVSLAVAGMGLLGLEGVLHADGLDLVGVAFALLAGAFWAGYILTSSTAGRLVPGNDGLAVALVVSTVVVMPLGASGAAAAFADVRLLAFAAAVAVLASVIPYSLEFAAVRRLPKHVFGVLLSLEPIVAAVAGWLLLDQSLGAVRLGAIMLIVFASMGTTVTASRARRRMLAG